MTGSTREFMTDDGMLVQQLSDGSTIRKCVTEECIQNHVGGGRSQSCGCEACTSKRLSKAEGERRKIEGHEVSLADLEEMLPTELYEAVMDHLALDEGPSNALGEVGKSMVLAESLYDEDDYQTVEKSGASAYAEKVAGSILPDAGDATAKTSPALDRFYESMEGA